MIKHHLAPFLWVILLHTTAAAQTKPVAPPRWSLSLTAGPSFPVGRFGGKDAAPELDVAAHTGAGAQLALTWWAIPSVGVVLATTGQIDPIGIKPTSSVPPSYLRWNAWKIARFLGGITVNLPLSSKRFSLGIKALAGTMKTSAPGYTVVSGTDWRSGTSIAGQQHPGESLGLTFTWEAGASLKWQLKGSRL